MKFYSRFGFNDLTEAHRAGPHSFLTKKEIKYDSNIVFGEHFPKSFHKTGLQVTVGPGSRPS